MKRIKLILLTLLIGATLIPPLSSRAGLEEGLVGYWSFDEGSGTIAADTLGNGNDGTIHGATWVNGKVGKALKFDGVDDYVEISKPEGLDIADKGTIVGWIKSQSPENHRDFIGKGDAYVLRIDPVGKASFVVKDASCTEWYGSGSSVSYVDDDGWHQIAGVYDGSFLKIFVDGALETQAFYDQGVCGVESELLMGKFYNHYLGILDELRIYNKDLKDEEVLDLYLEGVSAEEIEAQITKREEQISRLQVQIAELKAQLAKLTGRPTIPGIPEGYKFTGYLYQGKQGNDVRYLQEFLKAQGSEIYPEGLVTGYFGRLTTLAVARFQIKHGIVSSMYSLGAGHVGPKTRAKINELLGY